MRYFQILRIPALLVLCQLSVGCWDGKIDMSKADGEYWGTKGQYFDAQIDGTDWWPWNTLLGPIPLRLQLEGGSKGNTYLCYFKVERDHSPSSILKVTLDTLLAVGSFSLGDANKGPYAEFSRDEASPSGQTTTVYYATDSLHTGTFTITSIDSTQGGLVSGTVSFDAVAGKSVVRVRNGSFLVDY